MDFTASPLQTRMGIPAVCCCTLVFQQGDFNHEKNNHTLKIQPVFNGNDSFHSHTMTIQPAASETEKTADINFYNSEQNNLYQLSVSFPFVSERTVSDE